jgi:hypothetical protein
MYYFSKGGAGRGRERGRKEVSACGEEGRVPHIFSRKCCLVSFLTPPSCGVGGGRGPNGHEIARVEA